MTTRVVTAYVGNNAVLATDLPALINGVYGALTNLGKPVEPCCTEAAGCGTRGVAVESQPFAAVSV